MFGYVYNNEQENKYYLDLKFGKKGYSDTSLEKPRPESGWLVLVRRRFYYHFKFQIFLLFLLATTVGLCIITMGGRKGGSLKRGYTNMQKLEIIEYYALNKDTVSMNQASARYDVPLDTVFGVTDITLKSERTRGNGSAIGNTRN